jgi:hypothetical protein
MEQDHPNLKDSLLSAMGNVKLQRLLDSRYLDPDEGDDTEVVTTAGPFPILTTT